MEDVPVRAVFHTIYDSAVFSNMHGREVLADG